MVVERREGGSFGEYKAETLDGKHQLIVVTRPIEDNLVNYYMYGDSTTIAECDQIPYDGRKNSRNEGKWKSNVKGHGMTESEAIYNLIQITEKDGCLPIRVFFPS